MLQLCNCLFLSPAMDAKLVPSSTSSLVPSFFSPFHPRSSFQFRSSRHQPVHLDCHHSLHLKTHQISSLHISFKNQKPRKVSGKRAYLPLSTSEEQFQYTDQTLDNPETTSPQIGTEEAIPRESSSIIQYSGNDGKPGFISFYNPRNKTEYVTVPSEAQSTWDGLVWIIGPSVLVSSFILPPIYLRRIVSAVFEDSLLTDFLILFFTEALFYCGLAGFLGIIDRSSKVPNRGTNPTQLGQKISSVITLVLSLTIPMVTMGFVWPWTGPAASATLAPYLVGIVVQFGFEQYARHMNSPSSHVIPIIFQVYRLHQLNRAAQLVTALSFTVKGAELTVNNLAIKKSLGTLLNVIQVLGVVSVWSISSFLVWLSSSPSSHNQS